MYLVIQRIPGWLVAALVTATGNGRSAVPHRLRGAVCGVRSVWRARCSRYSACASPSGVLARSEGKHPDRQHAWTRGLRPQGNEVARRPGARWRRVEPAEDHDVEGSRHPDQVPIGLRPPGKDELAPADAPADALGKDRHLAVLLRPPRKVVHVAHGPDGAVKAPPHQHVVVVRAGQPCAQGGRSNGTLLADTSRPTASRSVSSDPKSMLSSAATLSSASRCRSGRWSRRSARTGVRTAHLGGARIRRPCP